jgi:Skp family chaperone for outer membrane proteins
MIMGIPRSMRFSFAPTRLAPSFLAGAASAVLLFAAPAFAQQQPEWFVPGQGQQRPAGQPAQRPAGQPAQAQQRPPQRPATQAPAPLPPGQQPPAAVIGIVDVPEIQRVSTAFSQVRDEIERRRQRLNDDLQREQNNWREQQQQLANQRASLPADQLRERERSLQDRITDSQRIFRERSRTIEQAAQQSLVEIEQTLGVVIRQVAASRSVNLVLPRPLVIFNDPPFDLTEEVATQFNKVLKSVNMPPEASGTETPASASAPAARPASPPAAQGQPQQRR